MSDTLSNTGHYWPPRWTCPRCINDFSGNYQGRHKCPSCGASLMLSADMVPSFKAEVVDDDSKDNEEVE